MKKLIATNSFSAWIVLTVGVLMPNDLGNLESIMLLGSATLVGQAVGQAVAKYLGFE